MGFLISVPLGHGPGPSPSSQRNMKDVLQRDDDHAQCSYYCSSNSSSSSVDQDDDDQSTKKLRGAGAENHQTRTFPWQLHSMLEAATNEGFHHIVSWLDDNASFKVHKPALFVQQIMPRFFERQSKYKSFQRQLNTWQFERLIGSRGPCNGGYHHVHFHRTKTSKFHLIKRLKIFRRRHPRPGLPYSKVLQEISQTRTTLLDHSDKEGLHVPRTPPLQYLTTARGRIMYANSHESRRSSVNFVSGMQRVAQPEGVVLLNPLVLGYHHQQEQCDNKIMTAPNLIPSRMSCDTTVVTCFSPSSASSPKNKNVAQSGMMMNFDCDQPRTPHQQRVFNDTSSRTNNTVKGRIIDVNTNLSLRRDGTKLFRQVFSPFMCSCGDTNTNRNGTILDADELEQCLRMPRNEETRRHQEDAIISKEDWKYVLIGLRIGAMASS